MSGIGQIFFHRIAGSETHLEAGDGLTNRRPRKQYFHTVCTIFAQRESIVSDWKFDKIRPLPYHRYQQGASI